MPTSPIPTHLVTQVWHEALPSVFVSWVSGAGRFGELQLHGWTPVVIRCVMILKSQNQGGALWFLAVLWYYLPESTKFFCFSFLLLPTPFLSWKKTFFHPFGAFLSSVRHFTKKNNFETKGLWTLKFLPSKWDHLQSQSWSNIERLSCLWLGGTNPRDMIMITTHGDSPIN